MVSPFHNCFVFLWGCIKKQFSFEPSPYSLSESTRFLISFQAAPSLRVVLKDPIKNRKVPGHLHLGCLCALLEFGSVLQMSMEKEECRSDQNSSTCNLGLFKIEGLGNGTRQGHNWLFSYLFCY